MTTLPPESSGPGSATAPLGPPHRQRAVAEGFGADASQYDRARPTYPAELVERIVAASPGRDVVDVGCGPVVLAGVGAESLGDLALLVRKALGGRRR